MFKKLLVKYLVFFFLLFNLTFVYFYEYESVGKFPAESLDSIVKESALNNILCLPISDISLFKNLPLLPTQSIFEDRNDLRILNADCKDYINYFNNIFYTEDYLPSLNISIDKNHNKIIKYFKKNIKNSDIYYSKLNSSMVSLDQLNIENIKFLWDMVLAGKISKLDLYNFKYQSCKVYKVCQPNMTDIGITEAYWASKGTNVLHHWVHMYEATASGLNKHAQYGYLLPSISKKISELYSLEKNGPTQFVQITWIILFLITLIYTSIFIYIFKENINLALIFIFIKIYLFSRLGEFVLQLAPGYHWLRDLILIASPLIFITIINKSRINNTFKIILIFLFFLFFFYLDSVFTFISIICLLITFLIQPKNIEFIINFYRKNSYFKLIKKSKKYIAITFFLFLLSLFYISYFFLGTKLEYILDKFINGNAQLIYMSYFHFRIISLVIFISIMYLIVSSHSKLPRKQIYEYFALLAIFCSSYFVITPDDSHLIKTLEYSLPIFLIYIISIKDYILFNNREKISKQLMHKFNTIALPIIILILTVLIIKNIISPSPSFERRIVDKFNQSYTKPVKYIINNKIIYANLSEKAATHIKSYPHDPNVDFIISPFDKYINFLYDKNNGLGSPDLISFLDSNNKIKKVINTINKNTGQNHKSVIIVDAFIYNIDSRYSIRKSHSILGSLYLASRINLEGRIRARDLAEKIKNNNSCKILDKSSPSWIFIQCDNSIPIKYSDIEVK